jgi:ABC-type transport system involved in multi-copper enzyme maturation permease subunit
MMPPVLIIARLTLRETARRKLLLALAIITVIVALLTGWVFHKLVGLPCENGSNGPTPCSPAEITLLAATLLILLSFMFSFVLALGAAFVAAPSIASDIESGIQLSMVTRPIRRSDVVLGKWLGLGLLLAVYGGGTAAMEFVIMKIAMGYVPPHPILAIFFIVAEGMAVLTLSLLASTRLPAITGGVIVLVLFGAAWLAGIMGSVGAAFQNQTIENIGTVASLIMPTDGLWRQAIYNLQPAALQAVQAAAGREGSGNPFFVTSPATTPYLIWVALWLLVCMALTIWSFRRREL